MAFFHKDGDKELKNNIEKNDFFQITSLK